MPFPHAIGTMSDGKRMRTLAMAWRGAWGLLRAGRTHRGHGDPVAAETASVPSTELFPDKSPLGPFFDPSGDRREGGSVRFLEGEERKAAGA